jgi:hypothetical protein
MNPVYTKNEKHSDSLADRQKLWLMCHAQMAFITVKEACLHIITKDLKYGDALFYPLFTSIVVNYARSFKRSNLVGKLVEEMVPAKHSLIHKQTLLFRDKLIAHTDGDGPQDQWGRVNEVRYQVGEQGLIVNTTEFHFNRGQIKGILELSNILLDKIAYHIRKIERKHLNKVPKSQGEYVLNIDPAIDEYFVPAETVPEKLPPKWI